MIIIRIISVLFVLISLSFGQVHLSFIITNHSEILIPDSLKGVKKITTKKCDVSDGECETVTNEYGQNGLMTSSTKYDNKGNIDEKRVYSYNSQKQLIAYAEIDDHGKTNDKEEYVYDYKSRLLKFDDFDDNGKVERRLSCFYDDETGLLSKQINYEGTDKVLFTYTFSNYNAEKHSVKVTVTDENGKVIKIITKEYQLF
jgi:hypothetical protein